MPALGGSYDSKDPARCKNRHLNARDLYAFRLLDTRYSIVLLADDSNEDGRHQLLRRIRVLMGRSRYILRLCRNPASTRVVLPRVIWSVYFFHRLCY